MKKPLFVKRVLESYALLAPFIGNLGTVYGIYVSFTHRDQVGIPQLVLPAIWSALLWTVSLIAISFPIVALYTFLRGE